jgi:cysteine desulfurase
MRLPRPLYPDEAFVFLARRAQRSLKEKGTMASRIYFDHSATTPLDTRVFLVMEPFLGGAFGNPSSQHSEGRKARQAIENARAQVAALLGADPSEIIFTASGTEADNLALIGAVHANDGPCHVVTSSIEHPAVLETCRFLERSGTKVTHLPVDRDGIVDVGSLAGALRPETRLVSIMAANNIVGTIQPLDELARITKRHGALFHTDAVQAAGKIPLDVTALPLDLVSLSAHKLHGPKGVGALYVRAGVRLSPIVYGGGQERGLRSATENVAGIVGFGAAAALAKQQIASEATRLAELRERIVNELKRSVPHACLIGHPAKRLPGHLCLGLRGQEAQIGQLLEILDAAGVAVSSGSACNAHHPGAPSVVLVAMGYDAERATGLLRITLGRFNSAAEVNRFLEIFPQAVAALAPPASHGNQRHAAKVGAHGVALANS